MPFDHIAGQIVDIQQASGIDLFLHLHIVLSREMLLIRLALCFFAHSNTLLSLSSFFSLSAPLSHTHTHTHTHSRKSCVLPYVRVNDTESNRIIAFLLILWPAEMHKQALGYGPTSWMRNHIWTTHHLFQVRSPQNVRLLLRIRRGQMQPHHAQGPHKHWVNKIGRASCRERV